MPNPGRVIAALILLSFAPVAVHAATVTGSVVDAVSRAPLSGMTVEAYAAAGTRVALASTDAAGLYQMKDLPAGDFRLLAYDPAGVLATAFDGGAESFETTRIVSLSGNTAHRADFALVKAGFVSGQVTGPGLVPLSGLTVAAYNPSGTRRGFTKTAGDGTYSLVLPPGTYKLASYDETTGGWATVFYKDASSFAAAAPVAVSASVKTTGIDFKTSQNARLNGLVVDADTQTPISGASVYAYTQAGALLASANSDLSGAFRLAVPAGSYRLVAVDPATQHAPSWYRDALSFERAENVTVTAGEQRNALRFSLRRGSSITGRVSDSSGAPLGGITVGAYNFDGTLHVTATTASDGSYALFVAPGEFRIGAFDATLAYVTAFYPAARDFAGAASLPAVAGGSIPSIDLQLTRGGRVAGVVSDARTAQPVAGATVAVYDSASRLVARGTSAVDGRYAVAVAPGAVRVLAFDPQLRYATAFANGATSFESSLPITINVNSESTVNFALRSGIRVGGNARSAEGDPLDGIEVFALDSFANRVASATSSGGAFTLVVVPGVYRFVAVDPSGRRATRFYPNVATFEDAEVVSIAAGSPPALSFVLEGASRRRSVRH